MKSIRVSATEFQKEYGRYASLARRQAVTLTNHGRAQLVILDAKGYERLRRLESRVAIPRHQLRYWDGALMAAPDVVRADSIIRDQHFQNSRRRESRSLLGADGARKLNRCAVGE